VLRNPDRLLAGFEDSLLLTSLCSMLFKPFSSYPPEAVSPLSVCATSFFPRKTLPGRPPRFSTFYLPLHRNLFFFVFVIAVCFSEHPFPPHSRFLPTQMVWLRLPIIDCAEFFPLMPCSSQSASPFSLTWQANYPLFLQKPWFSSPRNFSLLPSLHPPPPPPNVNCPSSPRGSDPTSSSYRHTTYPIFFPPWCMPFFTFSPAPQNPPKFHYFLYS